MLLIYALVFVILGTGYTVLLKIYGDVRSKILFAVFYVAIGFIVGLLHYLQSCIDSIRISISQGNGAFLVFLTNIIYNLIVFLSITFLWAFILPFIIKTHTADTGYTPIGQN